MVLWLWGDVMIVMRKLLWFLFHQKNNVYWKNFVKGTSYDEFYDESNHKFNDHNVVNIFYFQAKSAMNSKHFRSMPCFRHNSPPSSIAFHWHRIKLYSLQQLNFTRYAHKFSLKPIQPFKLKSENLFAIIINFHLGTVWKNRLHFKATKAKKVDKCHETDNVIASQKMHSSGHGFVWAFNSGQFEKSARWEIHVLDEFIAYTKQPLNADGEKGKHWDCSWEL